MSAKKSVKKKTKPTSVRKAAKRRRMSDAGRANISKAARKRWAAYRKAKKAAAK